MSSPPGVLDVLLERGLRNFDLAVGASAGACNLARFVAGQHERNLRCHVNIMARKELFSLRRVLAGGQSASASFPRLRS